MSTRIAIIGLGYVGLPLACLFATKYSVAGFDVNQQRVQNLKKNNDANLEVSPADLASAIISKHPFHRNLTGLYLTANKEDLGQANVYIITVPTPVNKYNQPDLSYLEAASSMVGSLLKKDDIVIYESTVYPGCTEEVCVPVLEKASGLIFNKDFFCGYSPERINPGDKINTIEKIKKITSGSNKKTAEKIERLYASVITAGTYKAPSIKVAEAAKAIENAQRDLNISFVNELALIFDKIGIDTNEVIEAAATKWNFIKYKPGLVGGHCIGVDPYYLVHKAEAVGYKPEVILSGRRVNDNMPLFVVNKLIKLMINKNIKIKKANVLILGFAFKENCSDYRNTKVIDMYKELQDFGISVDVVDPWVDKEKVKEEYGLSVKKNFSKQKKYNGIILAVAHADFLQLDWKALKTKETAIFDVKSVLDKRLSDARL